MTNTELAVLGLVAEEPKHGYQIEQDIERRGMREWTEIGFSSIYYILNKLEDAGWLASEKLSVGERPARKVYRLTEAGQQAYREAVKERLAHPRPRTGDFDLGLANLMSLPPAESLAALKTHRALLAKGLERVNAKWEQDGRGSLPYAVEALFDHSISMMQAELSWLDSFIRQLDEINLQSRPEE